MLVDDLKEIAEKEKASHKAIRIHVCSSTGCISANSLPVRKALEAAVKATGLDHTVEVVGVGCMDFCGKGPIVQVVPEGTMYQQVNEENAPAIVAAIQAASNGTAAPADAQTPEQAPLDHPFFQKQLRIVRENCGKINPEKIEAYIAAGGYQALAKALLDMSPAEVVEEITQSGLRGRGGGGYPTGLKWATVAKQESDRKFVVCNADEGDPGAFMDRSLLEDDPHRILEGMAIAAYAVGASQGYVYVRAEYPLAIERLNKAIQQARRQGILGAQIFESKFDFRIDVRIGAGAFVCGEETALMNSIEGRRGVPRPRPPFPAQKGLWEQPTLLNNVETFATIAPIIKNGADWFAGIGTDKSKGTKIFALTGKIENTGLVEVPMGIKLREIVEEIGGGSPTGLPVKAVQTGGPAGGCIPASQFDTNVDYESLGKIGSIMGSGGMIVMDEDDNMVEVARFFMEFCMDESCGKCIPCRAGTVQIHRLLTKIRDGLATTDDLQTLEDLCDTVRNTSLCGLGQLAPNPVLSTLRYFRDEYTSRLRDTESDRSFGTVPVPGAMHTLSDLHSGPDGLPAESPL